MACAHESSILKVVKAGSDLGGRIMGGKLGREDKVASARYLQDIVCDYVIHHIGYD